MQITYEQVHKLFRYDGKDLIRIMPKGTAKEGSVAGYIRSKMYRRIKVNNKDYPAHHLVWFFHYGYFPEHQIDHINRNKADNRIENLREVSQICNTRNCGNYCHNISGVKGVSFSKTKKLWVATICVAEKNYTLGRSKNFDEAVLLRLAAEQCLNWGSCDTNSPARKYAIKNNLFKPPIR